MKTTSAVLGLVLLAIIATTATGQAIGQVPPAAVRTLRATRAAAAVRIDGKLDEQDWAAAPKSGGFTQSVPTAGLVAKENTEVRVLYDDDALYVGIRMFDSHPDSIASQLARRDAAGIYSDWVHVVLDSYRDRRSGVRFSVNPRGVQADAILSEDRSEDANWDAVWEAGTSVDSLGWSAELRIPFSQLHFAAAGKGVERVWGIQIQRDIARRNERDSWSPWKPADAGFVSLAGDLAGITDIPTPRRLEVMPYVSSKLTRAPGNSSNPFYKANDAKSSIGADIKYGLPAGLTLTATVNPDFGQVEVDPAVVNLTAFESFFPEKRPFFVEGADIFNIGSVRSSMSFGSQQLFYSRRIGRAPQRFVGGAFTDTPDATTIAGAAKVTGKAGPWTIGLLDAVTSGESERVADASGVSSETAAEPRTNYFVGRARRELNEGKTVLSIGGTSVVRNLSDPVFKDMLRSNAEVGSLDFEHSWKNRQWALTGAFSGSSVSGSAASIANTLNSSAHYYQRPDASYLGDSSARTSVEGYSAALSVNKYGVWQFGATAKAVSPGFEVNDLGFMDRADYRNLAASGSFNNYKPGKFVRGYTVGLGTNHAWNYGGDAIEHTLVNFFRAEFVNLWSVGGALEYDAGVTDDRLTRGGPLGFRPAQHGALLYGMTSPAARVSYNWNVTMYGAAGGGYSRSVTPGIDIRPSASVHVTLAPGVAFYRNPSQYLQETADASATATFGKRYVFADLQQTTVSATMRVEWTVSPTLSLQSFVQPFSSSGSFTNLKELAKPGSNQYAVYGRDDQSTITPVTAGAGEPTVGYSVDPDAGGAAQAFGVFNQDFRLHSMRGNAVVRWQYRQGSALFLVWQQQRTAYDPFEGDFRASRDIGAVFGRPSNVLVLKSTYWFGR